MFASKSPVRAMPAGRKRAKLSRLVGLAVMLLSATIISIPVFANPDLEETSAADPTEAAQFQRRPVSGKPKIGLALGGGGARGGATIGVLKVLKEEGIDVDLVTGTSIGAVAGVYYSAGVKPEEMIVHWENSEVMDHFMTVPLWMRIVGAPILFVPRIFGGRDFDGLYKGSAWRDYLAKNLPHGTKNIEDLPIKFGAVCFNLCDGKPYIVRKGNLGKVLQATCAVPSLRKPVDFDGDLLCDGGIICNLPVKQCRQMGADFVIAVNIDEGFKPADEDTFRHPTSVAKRMILWGLYDMDRSQEKMADFVIHPDTNGVSLISTKRRDARRSVESGEAAARACVAELKAKIAEFKKANGG